MDKKDKKLSLKQKGSRDFVNGRVQANVSIRKQKREERMETRRAFQFGSSSGEEFETDFTRLASSDLKAACGMAYENIGKLDDANAVEMGLIQLRHLVSAPDCNPAFPHAYALLPPQLVMDRLCAILKTRKTDLQGHVEKAAWCVTHICQAHKMGDLEYRWSNAVTHAKIVPVIVEHVLNNPNIQVRTSLLHAAVSFAGQSVQNARDAALVPALCQLLKQAIPQTFQYLTWYIFSMHELRGQFDWNELVGDDLWAFARNILKEAGVDPVLTYDCVAALTATIRRGNGALFERTFADVGLSRFIDMIHEERALVGTVAGVCRILDRFVYHNEDRALEVLQRGHAMFIRILTEPSWALETKQFVMEVCHTTTVKWPAEGAHFLGTKGYFKAAVAHLDKQPSSSKSEIVDIALELITNVIEHYRRTENKTTSMDVFRHIYHENPSLVQSICEFIKDHHPARQLWSLRILGHLLEWSTHLGQFETIYEQTDEDCVWEYIERLYNESPDQEMQELTEDLMKLRDRNTRGMDMRD
jgi:hypothetical protein